MCKGMYNKLCSNILESHFMSLLCFAVLCFFVFMFLLFSCMVLLCLCFVCFVFLSRMTQCGRERNKEYTHRPTFSKSYFRSRPGDEINDQTNIYINIMEYKHNKRKINEQKHDKTNPLHNRT